MSTEKQGLPRSRMTPERLGELYGAVLSLLAEVGYEALTFDAVAARARSSKTTLYRQWASKPELVAAALRHVGAMSESQWDTGTLRGDLIAAATPRRDAVLDASVIQGINNAARREPRLHEVLRELIFDPTMRAIGAVLERAIARGELPADNPALEYVPYMLMGATMAHSVLENREPDPTFVTAYVDATVLPALGVR